ncbi:MAG: hypothetical protein P1U88_11970 [Thalassobaculaceae bacterium]|nr:hypothetical protein [Thalassobaculaceae bacterium]
MAFYDSLLAFGRALVLFPGGWFYGILWFHPAYFTRFWEMESKMARIDGRYANLANLDFERGRALLVASEELDRILTIEIAQLRKKAAFIAGRAVNRMHDLRIALRNIVARIRRHRPHALQSPLQTGRDYGIFAIATTLLITLAEGLIGSGALVDMIWRIVSAGFGLF